MNDIEVYVDLSGETFLVGLARINRARGNETMVFEYDRAWLESTNRFALEPGLPLMRGGFSPGAGHSLFGPYLARLVIQPQIPGDVASCTD